MAVEVRPTLKPITVTPPASRRRTWICWIAYASSSVSPSYVVVSGGRVLPVPYASSRSVATASRSGTGPLHGGSQVARESGQQLVLDGTPGVDLGVGERADRAARRSRQPRLARRGQ